MIYNFRIGRRYVAMLCYMTVSVGATVAGILQNIETPLHGSLTNGFALCAYMGVTVAWAPVQAMTVELYPTVIRNIGFGTLSTVARIGAIAGPQLVFLNLYVPGILYFVCGLMSVASVIALIFLPETMKAGMADRIETTEQVRHIAKRKIYFNQ